MVVVVLGGLGDGDLESVSLRLLKAAIAEMSTLFLLEVKGSVGWDTLSSFPLVDFNCWEEVERSDLGAEVTEGRCAELVDDVLG